VDILGLVSFEKGLTVTGGGATVDGSLDVVTDLTVAGAMTARGFASMSAADPVTLVEAESGRTHACTGACTVQLPSAPPSGTR
jgi:hypothetical protein